MSFSNSGGGTLTVPSPTHVHHVDVLGTSVRGLRRSLSRSPSKFNLARTNSQRSDSSISSYSPADQSPSRRYTPSRNYTPSHTPTNSPPAFRAAAGPSSIPTASTTPQQPPPQNFPNLCSTHYSPNLKLSLRSAKSTPKQTSPSSRQLTRLRASPKSPLKRSLSASTNDAENAPPTPPVATLESSAGQEQTPQTTFTPRSPLPKSSIPRRPLEKSSRHSLHLDVSGSSHSHQSIFKALEGNTNSDMMCGVPGTGALKRSDALMDLDQPNVSSPVAKRRSLHGISGISTVTNNEVSGNSIFGGGVTLPTSTSFEIHDDGNREYELFGSGPLASREPLPSPTPAPAVPRRSGSLRRSTLQQRQHDRSSWGRRSGATHLAQMGGDFSTPTFKNRPRLSLDQFCPPQLSNDSPFTSHIPLPTASVNANAAERTNAHQPHPLSRTLTTSSSGNSLQEESPVKPAAPVFAKPVAPLNFAKSLPYGVGAPSEGAGSNVTPFKDVKPWPGAFMSTGLVSKVNRNPEEDNKLVMPDTPCKKPTGGFATYPPPPSSAFKKNGGRLSFGAPPPSPFTSGVSQPRSSFGNSGKGLALFQRLGSRHGRRGSLLSLDGEDKRPVFDFPAGPSLAIDTDAPPTPTKPSLNSSLSSLAEVSTGHESPSANRTLGAPIPTSRPRISRESTASPVEQCSPRTPSASIIFPDASALSLAHPRENNERNSFAAPVTPSGRDSFQAIGTRLMTPVNGRARGDDESLHNRFDRVELVGKGEFSTVYKVVKSASLRASFLSIFNGTPSGDSPGSPEPDRVYAVKKGRRPMMGPKDRQNKLREVRALEALTHADHVVRYIDSWEHDYHLFIQTEFCDEGSLDKFLSNIGQKGRLDDFRIWKIAHDICLGVQSIHEAGFIHLDLKPANIFITFEGILKIGDFGLATTWPAAKGVDAEGDREYIGPEILRGKFDKPADIFSLGLVLVEMACNIVLPDNGPSWVALRSGDFSEVPSLTFSTTTTTNTRDVAGVPTGLSHDDSLLQHTSTPDFSLHADGGPEAHAVSVSDSKHSAIDSPKRSELQNPPDFMRDAFHPNSLDQMARWMTKPEPVDRPTIQELLASGGMAWVAERRRAAATVFEGPWGPADIAAISGGSDEDTEMTDV